MGPPQLLVTAGPTHEPIDAVRYLGNRSSGALGILLADHAAALGWGVTLLLGPVCGSPAAAGVRLERFTAARDLQSQLAAYAPACDILVMAAAVADFTPTEPAPTPKLRRSEARDLTLSLSPTPDLLAETCRTARPDQLMVGFALEPAESMVRSARDKLRSKQADLIVANPLETMESGTIEASAVASSSLSAYERSTEGRMAKPEFALWLLPILEAAWRTKRRIGGDDPR